MAGNPVSDVGSATGVLDSDRWNRHENGSDLLRQGLFVQLDQVMHDVLWLCVPSQIVGAAEKDDVGGAVRQDILPEPQNHLARQFSADSADPYLCPASQAFLKKVAVRRFTPGRVLRGGGLKTCCQAVAEADDEGDGRWHRHDRGRPRDRVLDRPRPRIVRGLVGRDKEGNPDPMASSDRCAHTSITPARRVECLDEPEGPRYH